MIPFQAWFKNAAGGFGGRRGKEEVKETENKQLGDDNNKINKLRLEILTEPINPVMLTLTTLFLYLLIYPSSLHFCKTISLHHFITQIT